MPNSNRFLRILFLALFAVNLSGCFGEEAEVTEEPSEDPEIPLTEETFDLSMASFDGNLLEYQNGMNEVSMRLNQTQTCSPDMDGWSANYGVSTSTSHDYAYVPYTPPANDFIDSIQLFLQRAGTASGTVTVQLAADSGGVPGAVIATSSTDVNAATINDIAGQYYTFAFGSPPAITAGTLYHIVLVPNMGFATGAGGSIRISYSDSCNNSRFGNYQAHHTGGSIWNAFYPGVMKVHTSGSTSYSAAKPYAMFSFDTGVNGTVWDYSTFMADENPNGETGSFRYSIEVTNNNWYTFAAHNNLTLAQVQALGTEGGRYVFIKVYFVSNGTQDGTISDVKMSHQ